MHSPTLEDIPLEKISLLDKAGVFLSGLCIIHCLATAAIVTLFPVFAPSLPHDLTHEILIIVLFLVAGACFYRGYLRHGKLRVPLLGTIGIALVVLAIEVPYFADSPILESLMTTAGSVCLILAHLINLRHLNCKCCEGVKSQTAPLVQLPRN